MELAFIFSIINFFIIIFVIKKIADIFHPLFIYSIFFLLAYSLSIYIYIFFYHLDFINKETMSYFNLIYPFAFVYYLLNVFTFFILKNLFKKKFLKERLNIKINRYVKINLGNIKIIGFFYLSIGFLFYFCLLYKISKPILLTGDYHLRITQTSGNGLYLHIFFNCFIWGFSLIMYYLCITKKRYLIFIFLTLEFLLGLNTFLYLGARTISFFPLLISLLIYLYIYKINFRKIFIISIVLFIFVLILEPFRKGIDKITDIFKISLIYILYGLKGSYAHFNGLFAILENYSSLKYQLFYTYKDIIVYWIPRFIYPGKPVQFCTGGFVTKSYLNENILTMVPSNIGEWIVQLGYVGILVGGIISGIVIFLVYYIFKKLCLSKPQKLILYFCLYFSLINFATRTSLEIFLLGLPPKLFFYFLTSLFLNKKK